MEAIVMFLVLVIGFSALDLSLRPLRRGLPGATARHPRPVTGPRTHLITLEATVNSFYAMLALDLANDRAREARGRALRRRGSS